MFSLRKKASAPVPEVDIHFSPTCIVRVSMPLYYWGCVAPIIVLNQRYRNEDVYVSQRYPDLLLYLSITILSRNLIFT